MGYAILFGTKNVIQCMMENGGIKYITQGELNMYRENKAIFRLQRKESIYMDSSYLFTYQNERKQIIDYIMECMGNDNKESMLPQ